MSRSYLGPEIRGVGNTSPSPGTADDSSYSLGLSPNWEIDLFGRLRRANEAARAQMLAAEDFQRGVVNALVADVATTWFRLRELDEEVAIIERTIHSQEASLALVRSQKRNGVASAPKSCRRCRSCRPRARSCPSRSSGSCRPRTCCVSCSAASRARGAQPHSARQLPVPGELPVGIPAQLLARRPDLRQLENQLHAATANVGVAEARRFPYLSIGLTSFFGLISTDLGSLLDGGDPASRPVLDRPVRRHARSSSPAAASPTSTSPKRSCCSRSWHTGAACCSPTAKSPTR